MSKSREDWLAEFTHHTQGICIPNGADDVIAYYEFHHSPDRDYVEVLDELIRHLEGSKKAWIQSSFYKPVKSDGKMRLTAADIIMLRGMKICL